MSGQCLSPNDAGHALTPATHRCLGRPLPHQQANRMQAPPQVESHLWSGDIIRYYLQFPAAIPNPGVGTYTLLSLSPLSACRSRLLARLACLIHAANVHSEPESNPSIDWIVRPKRRSLSDDDLSGISRRDSICLLIFGSHQTPSTCRPRADAIGHLMVPVTIACRPKPKEIELPNCQ